MHNLCVMGTIFARTRDKSSGGGDHGVGVRKTIPIIIIICLC